VGASAAFGSLFRRLVPWMVVCWKFTCYLEVVWGVAGDLFRSLQKHSEYYSEVFRSIQSPDVVPQRVPKQFPNTVSPQTVPKQFRSSPQTVPKQSPNKPQTVPDPKQSPNSLPSFPRVSQDFKSPPFVPQLSSNSPSTATQEYPNCSFAFLCCYLLDFDLRTIIISTASIMRFGWWYSFVKSWSSGHKL